MSPGSSTESYLAFAHIGLRENPGKNLNQALFQSELKTITTVSDATVRLKLWLMSWVHAHLAKLFVTADITRSGETGLVGGSANPGPGIVIARKLLPSRDYCVKFGGRRALFRRLESVAVLGP
ncbi:hypothetical protein ANN_03814 [Periplaneta americana]|uniref:Per a allergen n=1 Tax=Periplaneta americana TaxID=6978 RepID=A0ABQ8TZX7_PERAM|nr:hypothetical protein ANN_03814 [Periplaneta americana]